MFQNCYAATSVDVSGFDLTTVTAANDMFRSCRALSSIDLSLWNAPVLSNMSGIFSSCYALATDPLATASFPAVTNLGNSYFDCRDLTEVNFSLWDIGVSTLLDMGTIFSGCDLLSTISGSADFSAVHSMDNMFRDCGSLTSFNCTGWDTSSLETIAYMFINCSSISTLDLTPLDMSTCTSMKFAFYNCDSLVAPDVSNWDTGLVEDMSSMFRLSAIMNVDVSGFDISSCTNMDDMFAGAALSTVNYDLLLVAWEAQVEKTGVPFDAGTGTQYSAGAPTTARGVLTGTSTWTIVDGGQL